MDNPNHSNFRYREKDNAEINRKAFERKEGFSNRNHSAKVKDQMNGMPIPMHMRGKDCP